MHPPGPGEGWPRARLAGRQRGGPVRRLPPEACRPCVLYVIHTAQTSQTNWGSKKSMSGTLNYDKVSISYL